MFTALGRVCKTGMRHFVRNGWLSAATISVMVLALSMILGVLLFSVLMGALVDNLQSKLDVSAYFQLNVAEEEILKIKNELLALPEVRRVEYISSAEALSRFKERYKDDKTILASLSELDGKVFEASLNIGARNPEDFQSLIDFLNASARLPLISKVQENKEVIGRLSAVITGIKTVGFGISILLAAVATLICFNTIRMAIYTLRDEVNIMKLVGGTNWFVRGPFLVEGFLYGIVSSLVVMLIFYPVIFTLSPSLARFFPGINLLDYFTENFMSLWFILLAVGALLGAASSMIAIRKYLRA